MLKKALFFSIGFGFSLNCFGESAQTVISFDEGSDVTGVRRLPLATLIKDTKLKEDNVSFARIRRNWRDRIIMSTSSLENVKKNELLEKPKSKP